MPEVGNHIVHHLDVDGNLAAAKLRVGNSCRIGPLQPLKPWDIGRKFKDFTVIDVFQHKAHYISSERVPASPPPSNGAKRAHGAFSCGLCGCVLPMICEAPAIEVQ